MAIPFIDLKAQYRSIKDEIDEAIRTVVENTAFVGGKPLDSFEENFATYCQSKYCVGVDNGTDAIYLALIASGIGQGDEVLIPANSFIATAEAVSQAGAIPVFIDCHPDYYNLNTDLIEEKITAKTKAIIPVHLYGQTADMDTINSIAKAHGLIVIEDAAQAHGALYKGRPAGSLGDIGCFSFYAGKNLGAYGNGGAVTCNDPKYAETIRMLINHGQKAKYQHEIIGMNSRLDTLQAAILDVKLKHLDGWNEKRRAVSDNYKKLLKDMPIALPEENKDNKHVYHLFVIRTDRRDQLSKYLNDNDIANGIHYPEGIPYLKAYEYLGQTKRDNPITYAYQSRLLSLPMYAELNDEQIEKICKKIMEFYQ